MRASEELNRSILESSTDCIKLLDMDEGVLSMNGPGLCLMEVDDFGMIEGQHWGGFWKGEAADLARAAVEAAKAGGAGRFQGFCPTLKGTPKWWDVTATPHQIERMRAAGAVEYLTKPLDVKRFLNILDEALGDAKMRGSQS